MNKDFIAYGDIFIPKHLEPHKRPKGWGVWAKYGIEVIENGKIIDKREGPSHSFVRNLGRFVRNFLLVTSNVNEDLIDSSGTAQKPAIIGGNVTSSESTIAAAGVIKFGNSAAAVTSTQFELQGTILGTSGAVVTTSLVEDALQAQWQHQGQVTNSTGSNFTVREMAIYAQLREATPSGQNNQIMMIRDLTGDVLVGNTLTILGRYTITVAV